MLRVLCFAFVLVFALHQGKATPPEVCQVRAGPKHCLIETSNLSRRVRYEYNWDSRDCYAINWSSSCDIPVGENNFKDYDTCYKECSGWA